MPMHNKKSFQVQPGVDTTSPDNSGLVGGTPLHWACFGNNLVALTRFATNKQTIEISPTSTFIMLLAIIRLLAHPSWSNDCLETKDLDDRTPIMVAVQARFYLMTIGSI